MSFFRPLILVCLVLVLAGLAAWRLAEDEPEQVRRSRILMGTVVEISAFGEDEAGLDDAVTAAFEEMQRVEALMSAQISSSDVGRLNAEVEALDVSRETAELVTLGLRVARESAGAFDMTLGRLKSLWDIEAESPRVPPAAAVAEALRAVGPEALSVEGTRVRKALPSLQVDLGGIAKGYAIDRAVEVLRRHGISSASVNAGGDLRLLGSRGPDPWRIGLQHPRKNQEVLAVVSARDLAVVTSGDYERYFERDGLRYHHLFDPQTGQPARRCQSVTVLASQAALADALATAVFVLGPQRGMTLLAIYPGVEGIVIDAEGRIHTTEGLGGRVEWL